MTNSSEWRMAKISIYDLVLGDMRKIVCVR